MVASLADCGRPVATAGPQPSLRYVSEKTNMLGLREKWKRMVVPLNRGGQAKRGSSFPEVVDRPLRRRFSPSYKLRIVEEADRCTEPGEVFLGESLYSSHLTTSQGGA